MYTKKFNSREDRKSKNKRKKMGRKTERMNEGKA